jgi:hypothetical protein
MTTRYRRRTLSNEYKGSNDTSQLMTYDQYNSTNHVALHVVTGGMEIKAVAPYNVILQFFMWLTAGIILLTVLLTIQAIQIIYFIGIGGVITITITLCLITGFTITSNYLFYRNRGCNNSV